MIYYICPTCKSQQESPDTDAGEKRSCPHCNQRLQVPQMPAPPRNKTVLGEFVEHKAATPPPVPRRAIPVEIVELEEITPHRGGGVLALGIVSVSTAVVGLLACLACPFTVFSIAGLVTGIIAIRLGRVDLDAMKDGEMDSSGHGQTYAGWVCGEIGFWIVFVQLMAVMAAFAALVFRR